MKKKMALLMAVVCLGFWGGGISAFATGPAVCPTCKEATLLSGRQHLDHWTVPRVFSDGHGNSITCYEYHSVDRDIIYCSKGCGIIWAGETDETVSHSLDICPSKRKN